MRYLCIFSILLLAASPAIADSTTGEISLGGRLVGGNGTETSAKFVEYQDIDDQVISDLSFFYSTEGHDFSGEAKNVGYDDQWYLIEANYFGKGKLSLWYDELTHNYSLNDKTMHVGTGTGNLLLSGAVTPLDAATWLTHDFKAERRQTGASFELKFDTPFFASGGFSQTKKEGTYPIGVQNIGITSRNPFEIPAPIDYTTNNYMVKAGYRTKKIFVQIDTQISSFDNDADLLEWQSTDLSAGTTYTLKPDNDSVQFGGQVSVNSLPVQSVFALRGSYAKNESNPVLPALAGTTTWEGDQTYTNIAASVKSRPAAKLTTKVAYHYTKKDNDAQILDYRDANDASAVMTHAFKYTKQALAVDGAYSLNSDNRLKAGYDYENVERPVMRHDAEETDTHTLFAEWKNSSFEMASSKLRYEQVMRSSDFKGGEFADMFGPLASEEIARYSRPFDAADKDQGTIRWQLDLTPSDSVDVGLELAYSKGDYDDTVIGRTEDTERSILLDASITLPMSAKLYVYAAYDKAEVNSNHVRYQPAADDIDGGVPVAAADENTSRYNWDLERTDVGTSFGVKGEMPLLKDRLKLSIAWDYQKNDGEADFSSAFQEANGTPLEDIRVYDDYKKQTVKFTGEYAVNDNMTVILGYTYEKFTQDDILTNDYVNIVDGDSFFSGAYADMNYEANIGTAVLSYTF